MMKLLLLFLYLLTVESSDLMGQSISIDVLHILDEGDNYIISQPNDASVNEKGIIAVAELRQAKVLIFNERGDFLREIGRRGNGPGEFQMVYHIELVGDHLFTLDLQLQRVSVFDVNTGNVLKTGTYKELFNGWSPSNTSSFRADGSGWLSVVVTDVSAQIGTNTKMKLVALNSDLLVSDKHSLDFDISPMLKGREQYTMSYYRPISNYNFTVDTEGILWAPYYLDGTMFRIPSSQSAVIKNIAISMSKNGVENRVFSDKRDLECYVDGRRLISSGGSSDSGPNHYAVARHSLHLVQLGAQSVLLYSEYSEQNDAFMVHYKVFESLNMNESTGGKVNFTIRSIQKPAHDLRRIHGFNTNGFTVVQYLEDGELMTAIAKISIVK